MTSPDQLKELTNQVKNNTEDVQSFLRDLEGWQKEMEQKDNQLRAKAKSSTSTGDHAAAAAAAVAGREQAQQTKPPAKRKVAEGKIVPLPSDGASKQAKEQRKIRAYDYDKWDKFDVDKALEDVDEKESVDDDEEIGEAQLRQQAEVEKERGNEYFKAGKFDEAINCYSRGIQCNPTSAVLPANRAMALLKKDQFAAAEMDCTVAVDLDPTYTKAFLRRATARVRLNKLQDARGDFVKVLELEPDNKQAKSELEKVSAAMERGSNRQQEVRLKVEEKDKREGSFSDNIRAAFSRSSVPKEEKKQQSEVLEPGQIHPVTKPPHLRSKKPLLRIPITEVGNVVVVPQHAQPAFSAADHDEEDSVVTAKVGGSCAEEESVKTTMTTSSKSSGLQRKVEEEISEKLSKANIGAESATSLPARPGNSTQFVHAWKSLSVDLRSRYLLQFATNDYPLVFKHSLEPKVFSEILSTLSHDGFQDRPILPHLLGLSRVPRISAIIMFMDPEDVEKVSLLLKKARAETGALQQEVTEITNCFQVA